MDLYGFLQRMSHFTVQLANRRQSPVLHIGEQSSHSDGDNLFNVLKCFGFAIDALQCRQSVFDVSALNCSVLLMRCKHCLLLCGRGSN